MYRSRDFFIEAQIISWIKMREKKDQASPRELKSNLFGQQGGEKKEKKDVREKNGMKEEGQRVSRKGGSEKR